jgi:hypothetical protein
MHYFMHREMIFEEICQTPLPVPYEELTILDRYTDTNTSNHWSTDKATSSAIAWFVTLNTFLNTFSGNYELEISKAMMVFSLQEQ